MEVAPGITMIDTLLGGVPEITAAYLVAGTSPALVEAGAQTSAASVLAALEAVGLGAGDLAWLVMTHVHLDHCGAVGELAAAFPRATVVVHERGARHLVAPERLVAASAAVYGDLAPLYGGLSPVDEGRVIAAAPGERISLGGTRELVMIDAPGHARHHMAVLDEATGAVMAGDALGVQFPGSGLYPAVPPPEFDLDAALATLAALDRIEPEVLLLGHFGPVDDPAEAIAASAERQAAIAHAAREAWRDGGGDAIGPAVERVLPLDATVGDASALERWRRLRWGDNNVTGLRTWLERSDRQELPGG
jgi:glyoxylase-like metal-dependent hydrolase (beta-lactamase superfamily II)